MDRTDKKILAELQLNGRLSITELAEKVGLSISPCHRRVKALEESGAIKGYRAELDPNLVGFEFSAIVFITLLCTRQISQNPYPIRVLPS
ncbi:Transcriptional regulator [Acinetobacter baumannii]